MLSKAFFHRLPKNPRGNSYRFILLNSLLKSITHDLSSMRSLILGGGGIATIKRLVAALPPFKCGCSVIGRLETSNAVKNSWESICCYLITSSELKHALQVKEDRAHVIHKNCSRCGAGSRALMVAKAGSGDRPAIPGLNSPPFLPVELCREAMVHN
ncbi:hypothetical protein DY000_02039800 [Brassica cretica]|uniref:Uncharacterized protein n=1 Tax=Brassica cretica TaxID=69181 RepID=A0ABQ7BQM7_BRACR|nr:hypothetical protein DY000_02039800 [Brassica cretica]